MDIDTIEYVKTGRLTDGAYKNIKSIIEQMEADLMQDGYEVEHCGASVDGVKSEFTIQMLASKELPIEEE